MAKRGALRDYAYTSIYLGMFSFHQSFPDNNNFNSVLRYRGLCSSLRCFSHAKKFVIDIDTDARTVRVGQKLVKIFPSPEYGRNWG